MADKPCELQLYRVRYGLDDRRMMFATHIAVEGTSQGSMDEASELAEEVRLEINADTGEDYQLQFLGCIGAVYVWCKV